MKGSICFVIGALLMFYAVRSSVDRDYVATGTLHISSDGPEKQVCEFRIGNATDSRKKLLIVSTPDMAIAQACRDHSGDHASLTLRFGEDFKRQAREDGTR